VPHHLRLRAAMTALLAMAGLLAATGCTSASHCGDPGKLGKKVVLQRGRSAQGFPWRLTASEQNGMLGLFLESPTGYGYSGGICFRAGPPPGSFLEGLGSHGSDFYYGPAPAAAVTVQLSARALILIPTRPLPHRAGCAPAGTGSPSPRPHHRGLERDPSRRRSAQSPLRRLLMPSP
jgi:hypothetical protein